ncbi:hypothetical protein [Nannocystis punicea]|uniref:Uncharacterized protein n=1 Tax=Nannocystis punicea TaxID=2995304 RepID=A0ABY7H5N3_9BACT|nr:hypothetical protein [Nannocystis poenicansa]WAS94598.1 hypothetical protein O0S08_00425 [Nannocystis poenicansa]
MRTSNNILILLVSTLSFAVGCDDEFYADFGEEEVIALRCNTPDCGSGLANTSRIGDHSLSNLSETLIAPAANTTSKVRIEGGTAEYLGSKTAIMGIDVEADGELKLKLATGGWIGGAAVEGATFSVVIEPLDGEPRIAAELKIAGAWCSPGRYDASMTICRYQFVTDIEPEDTKLYPESEEMPGYYHICPDEDEDGALDDTHKFSSVLSPNVSLFANPSVGPTIADSPGIFINGCINSAVAKGQFKLNAFYDPTAYRGLQLGQRTALLRAWMAWFNGGPRTVPGRFISLKDPLGGLFDWTSEPAWVLEAGYGAEGARCRGGAEDTGNHRYYIDPVLSLPGWSTLPPCTTADYTSYGAVLGVKVHGDL